MRPTTKLLLAAAALCGLSAPAASQTSDTVYRYNPRTNRSQTLQGTVNQDTLGNVVLTERDGKERELDPTTVLQISWGDLPVELEEGRKLAKRGAYAEALERLREAAGDDSLRDGIRATARLEAIEALVAWGTSDVAQLAEATKEAERFLADFPESRLVPHVRGMKARAAWLGGDAAAARDGFKALYEAGNGTAGYAPIVVAEAALAGAEAAVAAGDASGAAELFRSAEAAFGAVTSERDAIQLRSSRGADVAALGSSLSKIASGDFSGARSGLERGADSASTTAGIAAARLALGEAHLGLGNLVDAEIEFSWVAALDHTSADRRAHANLGLAKVAKARGGDGSAEQAKVRIDTVLRAYGDTPAAAQARTLRETL
ncbi:MAG: hypothetical protein AAFU73_22360 [Planctomycetota bacterium]